MRVNRLSVSLATLMGSSIELCTVFVSKSIADAEQRELMFWWKNDTVNTLQAIQRQLVLLAKSENLSFSLAITDSICRLAQVICEHSGDNGSAAIAIIMEELQDRLTQARESEQRDRDEKLKIATFKPSKRQKTS